VRLRLDHLIIRTGEPQKTLAELARRSGAPVLAEVEALVGGIESGSVRAGPLDLEVLKIGGIPPERPLGYGLGFVADVPLMEAVGELRALGFPVSAPAPRLRASAAGARPRSTVCSRTRSRSRSVRGGPASGTAWRARRRARSAASPCWRARGTNEAGDSLVVLAEYEFDARPGARPPAPARPWRASSSAPAGHRDAWERLPLGDEVPVTVRDDGPPGSPACCCAARAQAVLARRRALRVGQ
jgi:hypothetical protein